MLVRVSQLGSVVDVDDAWDDLIPTSEHCTQGERDVQGLRAFWESVVNGAAVKPVPRERFEAAVVSLETELAASLAAAGWWTLYDQDCITAAKVGRRAVALQSDIAVAAGVEDLPDRKSGDDKVGDIVSQVMTGVLILGGLWVVLNSGDRRKRGA